MSESLASASFVPPAAASAVVAGTGGGGTGGAGMGGAGMGGASAVDGSVSVDVTAQRPATGSFHQLLSEMNPLQYMPVVGTLYRAVTGDTVPDSVRELGSMVVSGLLGGPVGVAMNAGFLLAERVTGIDPEAIEQEVLGGLGIGRGNVAVARTQTAPKVTAVLTDSDPVPGNATDIPTDAAPVGPTMAGAGAGAPTPLAPASASQAGSASPGGLGSPAASGSPSSLASPASSASPASPAAPGSPNKLDVSVKAVAGAKKPLVPPAPWTPAQLSAYGVTKTASGEFRRGKLVGADVLNDMELASIGDTYTGDASPAAAAAKAPAA
jgi:hypothetical protein